MEGNPEELQLKLEEEKNILEESSKYEVKESMDYSKLKKMRYPRRLLAENNHLRDVYSHYSKDCNLCEYPEYQKNFDYLENGKKDNFAAAFIRNNFHGDNKRIIQILASVNEKDSDPVRNMLTRTKINFLKPNNQAIYAILSFSNSKEQIKTQPGICRMDYPTSGFIATLSIICDFESIEKTIESKRLENQCFNINIFFASNDKPLFTEAMIVRRCETKILSQKENVGICSMIHQSDILDIVEWIEYNLMLGASHIYLYNHLGLHTNHKYDTGMWSVLDPYIQKGLVDVFMWNYTIDYHRNERGNSKHTGDQVAAFNDCMYRFGANYKFLGFFDGDEFFVPVKDNSFYDVLKKYQDADGIINLSSYVRMHSRFKLDNLDDLNMITERYPHVDNIHGPNSPQPHIVGYYRKTFLQPKKCKFYMIHDCEWSINNQRTANNDFFLNYEKEMYISHFYFKKYEQINPYYQDYFQYKPKTYPLKRFIPQLKERVKKVKYTDNYKKIMSLSSNTISLTGLSYEFQPKKGEYLFPGGYYPTRQNLGLNPQKLKDRFF